MNAAHDPNATPDIVVSGKTVDRLMMHLSNPTVLCKGSDGSMHPFVDPNPVIIALRDLVIAEARRLGLMPVDNQGAPGPGEGAKPN